MLMFTLLNQQLLISALEGSVTHFVTYRNLIIYKKPHSTPAQDKHCEHVTRKEKTRDFDSANFTR